MEGLCALCEKHAELQLSHIIPKFIARWIKKTGATGYLRNVENERVQDGIKEPLLCSDCEQQFSRYENYFAKNFFRPLTKYVKFPKQTIPYDENLVKFILSISWRVLYGEIRDIKQSGEELNPNLEETLDSWKKFFMGQNQFDNPGVMILEEPSETIVYKPPKTIPNTHYIIPSYLLEDIPGRFYYKHFREYITRAADATLASDPEKTTQFIFIQLPRFSIVSTINPFVLAGIRSAIITDKGEFHTRFPLGNIDYLVNLVNSRVEAIFHLPLPLSEVEKIKKIISENPERAKESDTFKIKRKNQVLKKRVKKATKKGNRTWGSKKLHRNRKNTFSIG